MERLTFYTTNVYCQKKKRNMGKRENVSVYFSKISCTVTGQEEEMQQQKVLKTPLTFDAEPDTKTWES